MSLLKSVERLKRIDGLIKMEITGTAEEFAMKIGISRSMLMENLREMKELGAEISYCPFRRSYCYEDDFSFIIGKSEKIRGGQNLFLESDGVGHLENILELQKF